MSTTCISSIWGAVGRYGFTYPERAGRTSSSYLEIDNDYANPIYQQTKGLDALRVTIAHEFHHAIQFGYYQGSDSIWWQESTSTWMEEVVYPDVDDYLQYLPSFLGSSPRAQLGQSRGRRFSHLRYVYLFSFPRAALRTARQSTHLGRGWAAWECAVRAL